MKIVKRITLVLIGLILLFWMGLNWIENAIYEGEIQHERDNIEGSIKYNFREYPKAFERLYKLTKDFPEIQQLRFFDDGRVSFYLKHCLERKEADDYCFLLEIKDSTKVKFDILDHEFLVYDLNGRNINTDSWTIFFTGRLNHPNLPALYDQLNMDENKLLELKNALAETNVDVHEMTLGYTKTKSMAVFGIYSMLTSMDYIIPLNDNVDVRDYSKLNDHYYYGDAPTFRYYDPIR